MNKILKIAALAVFALALVAGASSADAAFGRYLTVGSTGTDVSELQTILVSGGYLVMPAGVPMGTFGMLTKNAVIKWQAAVGLPATGYFGPMSIAKIYASAGAGSSSNVVGCTSLLGYSSTTGMKCDSSSNNGGSNNGSNSGSLNGGAGDITVTEKSSGVEDEIIEGDEEVSILGFEVEAEGSDIEVTSTRVEFQHTGSGSDRLDRYIDEVQVMFGGKVVGKADVDDFSEDSDVYLRNIALNGVVVKEDDKEKLTVSITASNNIDSDDLSEDWVVGLGQVRFEDATGAILTDNTGDGVEGGDNNITETFSFEDLSSSGDVELNVKEGDEDINESPTISADETSDTNDVEILSFSLEAEGSEISLNTLVIDVTSSGAGVREIANDFRLMMGDEEVGTVTIDKDCDGGSDGFASSSDAAICVVVSDIDDDDVVIDQDGEEEFTLVADINDTEGNFTSGDSLSANFSGQVIASNADGIDADDENGDALTNSEFSGSADSTSIKFISTGVTVEMTGNGTVTEVLNVDTTSTDDQGKYVVDLVITAVEDDAYIALTAASSTSANTDDVGVAFYIENASTGSQVTTGTTSSATLVKVSGGTVSGNYLRVNSGQSATVRLTAYYDALTTGSYRLQVDSVGFNATSNTAANSEFDTLPADDFESDAVQVLN